MSLIKEEGYKKRAPEGSAELLQIVYSKQAHRAEQVTKPYATKPIRKSTFLS